MGQIQRERVGCLHACVVIVLLSLLCWVVVIGVALAVIDHVSTH